MKPLINLQGRRALVTGGGRGIGRSIAMAMAQAGANVAVASRSKMQSNFAAATQPGGIWERRLEAVGDAGIKAAAQAKKGNYSTGVQQASAKQLAAITKIIAYEAAGLASLAPKSGAGSGRTRMNEWFDYMSAGRGTLGA